MSTAISRLGAGCAEERGSALVLAMAACVLLLGLGSALILVGMTESAVSGSFVRGTQTAYLAEAAVVRAIVDLDSASNWTDVLTGLVSSSFRDGAGEGVKGAGGVSIDLSELTLELNRSAAARPFGLNNPRWRLFAWGPAAGLVGEAAVGYLAVWVADDPDEQDGDPLIDGGREAGRGVLLLTAHAFGPGNVRRMVEVVVSREPPRSTRVLVWRPMR
jgi:hypothetical protein